MSVSTLDIVAQTPSPGGVGPDELVEFWPVVVQAAWFCGALLVIVLLGWYVVGPAIGRLVRRRNRNNPTIQEAIQRYVRLTFLVVGAIVGAIVAGYGGFVGGSALVVAAGTLVVGVAGQTVIGSLVSGVVLVTDPEFNLGDYIEWQGGEGTVESITLRVTRVKTPDGELVTVPNTELTGESVTRPYGRGRFRLVERVGIDYEDDPEAAIAGLEAAAGEVDRILDRPAPQAFVEEFGGDAVVLRVHYWIQNPHRQDVISVQSRYALAAKRTLEGDGVTISPPSKRDLLGGIEVEEAAGSG
jgi:small-conductance mechanosensitive channel